MGNKQLVRVTILSVMLAIMLVVLAKVNAGILKAENLCGGRFVLYNFDSVDHDVSWVVYVFGRPIEILESGTITVHSGGTTPSLLTLVRDVPNSWIHFSVAGVWEDEIPAYCVIEKGEESYPPSPNCTGFLNLIALDPVEFEFRVYELNEENEIVGDAMGVAVVDDQGKIDAIFCPWNTPQQLQMYAGLLNDRHVVTFSVEPGEWVQGSVIWYDSTVLEVSE